MTGIVYKSEFSPDMGYFVDSVCAEIGNKKVHFLHDHHGWGKPIPCNGTCKPKEIEIPKQQQEEAKNLGLPLRKTS